MNDYKNQDCIDLILKEANSDPDFLADLDIYLSSYLNKIDKNAIFEKHYVDNNLAGIIVYYCNNLETKEAFITLVVVDRGFRGLGIAQRLMNNVIASVKIKGFERCRLEVKLNNPQAIRLYEKLNYKEDYRNDSSVFMSLLV